MLKRHGSAGLDVLHHAAMKHSAILLFALMSTSCLAALDSAARMSALPLLLSQDPENYLLDQLPEVEISSTEKLANDYEAKKMNPAFEEVTWEQLAINFLLQQEFAKAIECLERANNEAEYELSYYLPFKSYALQQMGRIVDAKFNWNQQVNEQEDNRAVLTQLLACALLQRRLQEANRIVKRMPDDINDESVKEYFEALIALGQGDLYNAQHQLLGIIQQANRPKETYLALAVSSLEAGGAYDVIGWLRKMFKVSGPYHRNLIAHHHAFSVLHEHEEWAQLISEFEIGVVGEELELTPPLLAAYQTKYSIPKKLRVNLALRLSEPSVPPQFKGLKLTKPKKAD